MNGDIHEGNNFGPVFRRSDSSENKNNQRSKEYTMVEDLEDTMPGVIPTISNHVALANGHAGRKLSQTRGRATNGHILNGRPNFRTMLDDAELDSHI